MAFSGKGKGTAHVVIRSLVSLELARMTNSLGLEFAQVIVILYMDSQLITTDF